MVNKNNSKNNNNNNSSNSLVFGVWLQTKITLLAMPTMDEHSISPRNDKKFVQITSDPMTRRRLKQRQSFFIFSRSTAELFFAATQ